MVNGILQTTLVRKEQVAQKTWAFIFKKSFVFQAGQYTTVFIGKHNRDFTIASSSLEKDTFTIVTKEGISEFKKNLFSLPVGSAISVKQPSGGFTLRENNTPKVLLAAGIGMTPFHSMISYVHKKNLKIPITLFVSFSKKDNMIFYSELKKIENENSAIKIVYTLSQDIWEEEMGRISKEHIKKYIKNFKEVEYMVAGGEKMVEDTESLLLQMGIPQENIRIDIFTGY